MDLLIVFGLAALAFVLVVAGMAVGVLCGRRSIRGSCGGLANRPDEDGNTKCALCTNPDEACQELQRRMEASRECRPDGPTECSEDAEVCSNR
ncbi:MAG: hypothetical protein KatS3mg111_2080 [Pirellulaceae bacterium]|nr:MAG: hypothetical protein KatS3mg111_2080 [Pirellulaceae bacterium]